MLVASQALTSDEQALFLIALQEVCRAIFSLNMTSNDQVTSHIHNMYGLFDEQESIVDKLLQKTINQYLYALTSKAKTQRKEIEDFEKNMFGEDGEGLGEDLSSDGEDDADLLLMEHVTFPVWITDAMEKTDKHWLNLSSEFTKQKKLELISEITESRHLNIAFGYVMGLPDVYLTFLCNYLTFAHKNADSTSSNDTVQESLLEFLFGSMYCHQNHSWDFARRKQYYTTYLVGIAYMMHHLFGKIVEKHQQTQTDGPEAEDSAGIHILKPFLDNLYISETKSRSMVQKNLECYKSVFCSSELTL